MHITESDLFHGLELDVMREIADVCREDEFAAGTVLFKEAENAASLYILEAGIVHLMIDENQLIYSVTERGEVFGWSSLVESATYTATATCATAAKALRIDTRKLQRIFDRHPAFGLEVFKRLAGIFNRRLTQTYAKFIEALKSRAD